MTGRGGRRRKQLFGDVKEKRGYWKLKEEALDRTLWRTRFGRGYRAIVKAELRYESFVIAYEEAILTLNLLTTIIVAPPSNASKWQMGFNSAFKGLG